MQCTGTHSKCLWPGKARSADESLPSGNETLPLEYQQPQSLGYAQANVVCVANQQGNNSWPTLPMLL